MSGGGGVLPNPTFPGGWGTLPCDLSYDEFDVTYPPIDRQTHGGNDYCVNQTLKPADTQCTGPTKTTMVIGHLTCLPAAVKEW